jgi:hypothetical protein
MKIRWLAALGLVTIGGCATCQTCRAISPTAQASPQVDRHDAPVPPRMPTPPDDEDLPPLPPLPVPSPGPRAEPEPTPAPQPRKTGRVTTTREVEGAAVVIEQHAPGTIIVNSPGATPSAPAAMAAAAPQAYPLIPGPVPDSLIFAAARRIGGGIYYAATGKCPPPRQPALQAMVPVTTYQAVPVQMAAPAPAPVQYVAVPVAAQAPAPAAVQPAAMASPQAPRKGWFHR